MTGKTFASSAGCLLLGLCACGDPAANTPLRVGIGSTQPMSYVDEAGRPRGFEVEALEEAAKRDRLTLEWKPAGEAAANNESLRGGQLDVIVGVDTPERRQSFWVSDSWWSAELVAVARVERGLRQEEQLRGLRLVTPQRAMAVVSANFQGSEVTQARNAVAAVEAVCLEHADAGIFAAMYLRELLRSPPAACTGIGLGVLDLRPPVQYSLIARPEREREAKRLRARLDEIIADGTLARIALRNSPVSTPQAMRMGEVIRTRFERRALGLALVAGAAVLLLSLSFGAWQYRSRRRLRRMNERLESKIEALRQSEERFRTLLESAPQAVLLIDGSGAIRYANARCSSVFGLLPEEMAGLDVQQLIPGWTSGGTTGESGWKGLRSGGIEFQAEVSEADVWRDGERLVLAFVADISERVESEAKVREAQRLECVGQLAGGVAHDFNNLLTVIKGYAELLTLGEAGGARLRESMAEISRAADRAAALTRQLLSFSKRQPTAPRIIDLNALLGDTEKMLRRLIPVGIEIRFRPATGAARVLADAGQIEQVVMNLLINARDAMPSGGCVTIEIRNVERIEHFGDVPPGRYVMLRVSDTGTGIPPEVRARIFEPFFTTKELGKGTGLGLSTVYGIVQQSGGFIRVDSQLDEGTTFEILLPGTEAADEERATETRAAGVRGSETVLVAEDDPAIRQLVTTVLQSSGYLVLAAGDGQAALELAEQHRGEIHLLLTDSLMPNMDGEELAERFASQYPRVRILHMSGYSEGMATWRDRQLLAKPFSPVQLMASVREVLDSPAA